MSDLAGGLASTANAAPAAPESTPAPAAPSAPSQPASSSAPVSLADHFRQLETPETPSDAPATPEAPTPAPAIAEQPQVDASAEETAGPIPFDRHKAVLESTRKKAAEEAVQQFQQQYGEAIQFAQRFNADPIGTFMGLGQMLQQHPEFGQQLKSHAARMLGQRQPKAPVEDPQPQPDLVGRDANGQEVRFYSDEQQAKRDEWRERQFEQRLLKQLDPVMQIAQERKAEQAKTQYIQQAVGQYKPIAEEVMAMPGFTEHRSEIIQRQQELFAEAARSGQHVDPMRLVLKAYREIVPAKLQQQQQQQLASTALAKAAGRDANPAAVAGSPPPTPKSIHEAFAQFGLR